MDIARCTLTGQTYTADEFMHLPAQTIAELRTHLTCPTCQAAAFFRRRTTDGKAACFGSNHHRPHCPESRIHPTTDAPQDQLASLRAIRVALTRRASASAQTTELNAPPADPRASATQTHSTQRGLRTLLRHIVTEPALLYSDVLIQCDGFPELPAHTFFRRFEQLTHDTHNGAHRGFWGRIISVRTTPARPQPRREPTPNTSTATDLWLNSGPPSEPSVVIPGDIAAAVLTQARRANPEDLVGCYILVLGQCRVSAKGKIYITPVSQTHVVFRDTEQV